MKLQLLFRIKTFRSYFKKDAHFASTRRTVVTCVFKDKDKSSDNFSSLCAKVNFYFYFTKLLTALRITAEQISNFQCQFLCNLPYYSSLFESQFLANSVYSQRDRENFHSCTMYLDTIEYFMYPTDAQLDCSKC